MNKKAILMICPSCYKSYTDEIHMCPQCNVKLLEARHEHLKILTRKVKKKRGYLK